MKKKVYTAPKFTCVLLDCKDLIATSITIPGGEGLPNGSTDARFRYLDEEEEDW